MPAVLISVLTSMFNWAWPRIVALSATALLADTVSTPLLDWMHAQINSQMTGVGAVGATFLTFTGLPEAITIIFASYAAVISIKTAKAAFSKKSGV
ncbi:DUF2523 domain-containing protein [Pseudomonas putida]|nr:DUF2523 domain-containing protein [Pseudomonas putida]